MSLALKNRGGSDLPLYILPRFAKIEDWCVLSGLTRTRTYDLLALGLLKGKTIGGRTIVDVWAGVRYLESLPDCRAADSHVRRAAQTVAIAAAPA